MPVLAFLLLVLMSMPGFAQSRPTWPALTGRVVDAANVIGPDIRASLDTKLKGFEEKSGDQVVVATVPSLEGLPIEDYANGLFRHWQLGQKSRDNGVLLLVAPNDRKVRIEVGYGLEGALTDALSSVIIRTAMTPRFKAGDYGGGIEAGIDAILSILAGDATEWQRKAEIRADDKGPVDIVVVFIFLVVLILIVRAVMRGRGGGGGSRAYRSRRGRWIVVPGPSGGWGGGFSGGGWGGGGGSFGGGFSGGGGSSGGGGASGSW